MIIRINLAPEIKIETNYRDIAPAMAVALIVGSAAYYSPILYADSISSEAQSISEKTAEKKTQLAALELDLNKIKAVQQVISELESRKQVVLSLADGRKQPVAVLETLQDLQLDRMWLESMEFKEKTLGVKGWAADYGVISEFVRRIKIQSGLAEDSNIDVHSFRPTFEASAAAPAAATPSRNEAFPVKFTDVNLKDSTRQEASDSPTNLPIQKFELEFNPHIEEAK